MGKRRHGVPVTLEGEEKLMLTELNLELKAEPLCRTPHAGWEDPPGVGTSEEWPLQPLPQNLSEAFGFHLGDRNCQPPSL